MSTRLVGIPHYFRNDPNRKLIGGLGMILAEWIHNYKCHDDAVNNKIVKLSFDATNDSNSITRPRADE